MAMLSQITTCKTNNGRATFFWHDRWLLTKPLAAISQLYTPTIYHPKPKLPMYCMQGSK
jgi:hypothetical protein